MYRQWCENKTEKQEVLLLSSELVLEVNLGLQKTTTLIKYLGFSWGLSFLGQVILDSGDLQFSRPLRFAKKST